MRRGTSNLSVAGSAGGPETSTPEGGAARSAAAAGGNARVGAAYAALRVSRAFIAEGLRADQGPADLLKVFGMQRAYIRARGGALLLGGRTVCWVEPGGRSVAWVLHPGLGLRSAYSACIPHRMGLSGDSAEVGSRVRYGGVLPWAVPDAVAGDPCGAPVCELPRAPCCCWRVAAEGLMLKGC